MKNKTLLIIFILVLVGAGIFFLTRSSGTEEGSSVSPQAGALPFATTPSAPSVQQDTEFASLLSTINTININTNIFQSPAYRALRNNPVVLGAEPVGRRNPFAPTGVDEVAAPATGPSIQTIQPAKVTRTSAEFAAQLLFGSSAPESTARVVFEYGTSDLFGTATTPVIVSRNGVVLVPITGLTPNTSYRVRAVASLGSSTITGNTMMFTTSR